MASAARLGEVAVAPDGVWWAESRAAEGGRTVLVHRTADGTTTDLLPAPWNARTRVHEYGGGAWAVADGAVFFTDFADQRLYRVLPGADPEPLTAAPEIPSGVRFADLTVTPGGQVLCVRETHTASGAAAEVVHEVVAVAPDGTVEVLVAGPDFVSDPRTGPDGALSWLQWQHPDMPWDAAQLVVRAVDGTETVVAGGTGESVVQPSWSADGSLLFLADRTGVLGAVPVAARHRAGAAAGPRQRHGRAAVGVRCQPVRRARRRPAGGGLRARRRRPAGRARGRRAARADHPLRLLRPAARRRRRRGLRGRGPDLQGGGGPGPGGRRGRGRAAAGPPGPGRGLVLPARARGVPQHRPRRRHRGARAGVPAHQPRRHRTGRGAAAAGGRRARRPHRRRRPRC